MNKEVCRAITFINYHIPIPLDMTDKPLYLTVGFFDGMNTQPLEMDYQTEGLQSIWRYTLRQTAENKGYFSYQNIFGFSNDAWNTISDEEFWSLDTDKSYPLTFVVCLQLSKYLTGKDAIEQQCKNFSGKIRDYMKDTGQVYVYGTVDKNDCIVCIKCQEYRSAVNAIKLLHQTGVKVIYSYSIFSVHREILKDIEKPEYDFLYREKIGSICLKGVTNSFDSGPDITLDKKYYDFCNRLIIRLYDSSLDNDQNKVLYDILGDNDFRLIARDVNLGKLLREFAHEGILCYSGKKFPYYLFTSSLVLNTVSNIPRGNIAVPDYEKQYERMKSEFSTPRCNELLNKINNIKSKLQKSVQEDERVVTFCQAIFQLLQSLKVLESAPTKKYDFFSLYTPFAFLTAILEQKLQNGISLGENDDVYEFIHKISMTLHGTLRTDIQFFQIRDFNAVVHYAPAKLRAFYAIWVLKLSVFYNKFGQPCHNYSFIFSPGMFTDVHVKQLFMDYNETSRLMLITVPERHLYAPGWLTMVLAHEVSHYVGNEIRNRPGRHTIWIKMSARVLELELQKFMYEGLRKIEPVCVELVIKEQPQLLSELETELLQTDIEFSEQAKEMFGDTRYHSRNSWEVINRVYQNMFNNWLKQIIWDYGADIQQILIAEKKKENMPSNELFEYSDIIGQLMNDINKEMCDFCVSFRACALEELLQSLGNITSEAVADLMAILTLELTPGQYAASFEKTWGGKKNYNVIKEAPSVMIRAALVMECVSKTVDKYQEWFQKNLIQFFEKWNGDVLHRTLASVKMGETGYAVLNAACIYKDHLYDASSVISVYERIYNPNNGSFEMSNKAYFNDRKIWEMMSEYLVQCMDKYMSNLTKKADLQNARSELVSTYRKISYVSPVTLMEEIENFLAVNEKIGVNSE